MGFNRVFAYLKSRCNCSIRETSQCKFCNLQLTRRHWGIEMTQDRNRLDGRCLWNVAWQPDKSQSLRVMMLPSQVRKCRGRLPSMLCCQVYCSLPERCLRLPKAKIRFCDAMMRQMHSLREQLFRMSCIGCGAISRRKCEQLSHMIGVTNCFHGTRDEIFRPACLPACNVCMNIYGSYLTYALWLQGAKNILKYVIVEC